MLAGSDSIFPLQVTIDIPDELAEQLGPAPEDLLALIKRGLRENGLETFGFARELIEFLARGPQPREIVAFRPSHESAKRASELLEKNREGVLTADEKSELENMASLNHLFSLIKVRSRRYLATP
jgi:hypothetical protein